MKKSIVKYLCLSLAIVLVMGLFAGCGEKDQSAAKTEKTTTAAQTTAAPEDNTPVELSILTYGQQDMKYDENIPVLAATAKKLNINLKWQNLPFGAEAEKLNLIFASGSYPDILIWPDKKFIDELADQGIIIPLDELIEKNGQNIKKSLDKLAGEIQMFDKQIRNLDGHIYNIPSFTAAGTSAGMVWAIREDWCQNVGMKIPETTDELYAVLKAFKEKDPNKNGEQDELPLVSRNSNYYLMHLVNSFGTQTGLYWDENEKVIKYGPITPEYKEALEFISKLYKEGLIDPEYITNTDDQFKAKIFGNKAGMYLGYINSMIAEPRTKLKKDVKESNLVAMLPVAGPRGDRFKQDAYNRIQFRGSITKSCKNPEAAMKLFDFGFSPEGYELQGWGIEEETFVKVKGQYQVLDKIMRNPDGLDPMAVCNQFGINSCLPHLYNEEAYYATSDPFVAEVFKVYSDPKYLRVPISVTLKPEESDETKLYTDGLKYVTPMIAKFITGEEPLTKWDEFIETANKLGVQKFVDIYTKAYKRQYGIQ